MNNSLKEILDAWKDNTCYFCGKHTKEDEDYVLFGVEAHNKNLCVKIIKCCTKCENDWISTYRR